MQKAIGNLSEGSCMVSVSSHSYLKDHPKEKLVYLSPQSKHTLTKFSHDDIYIVGAYVDPRTHKPISMEKATEQGIRTCKFPLDEYLHWGSGSKTLTLDQVVNILVTLKNTGGDWLKAFEWVPRRKLKCPEEIQEQEARRLRKMFQANKKTFSMKRSNYL